VPVIRHAGAQPVRNDEFSPLRSNCNSFAGKDRCVKASHAFHYDSSAYPAILALRTDNSQSDVVFADGVEHPHRATDVLE